MHRETNLQVENEETIEAQSARTLKRCWTESNSAFSFGARIFIDGAGEPRCVPRTRVLPRVTRASSRPPDFIHSCRSIAAGAQPCACRPGLPGWRAQKASVTLSFRRPCGRENGRQFSYKQNAEEGVRLDEKRGTKDRGGRGGWRRSFGGRRASVCPGFHEPLCGRHVRSDAICRHDGLSGRCVRIRCVVRIRMNGHFSDPALPARGAVSGPAGRPSGDRCARIDRVSHSAAFLRFLHPDDIAAAHRGGRTTVSARAAARACAVSPGLDGGAGVSRENECRRGKAR